jgi:pentatricopeptide repeat protein
MDGSTATMVLNCCAKKGRFDCLPKLCEVMQESGLWLTISQLASALTSLSQFTEFSAITGGDNWFGPAMQSVLLGNPKVPAFKHAQTAFGMRFMRLVAMELLEESHGAVGRRHRGGSEAISRLQLTDKPTPTKWKMQSPYSGDGDKSKRRCACLLPRVAVGSGC